MINAVRKTVFERPFFVASIVLIFVSVAVGVFVNYELLLKYKEASGKTRALFLVAFAYYPTRFFAFMVGVVGMVCSGISYWKKETVLSSLVVLPLGLLGLVLAIWPVWRVFL
ncbi:hypothetical protein FUAX_51300 (plasmid) [Fulvitalea axinellae]|uniref:Uncharacterized protein n=1 Tax=Fulvitalea axinellae TaxID=1182444 RepID=A0AAU9D9V6_9BACT|nr:hypothetical protein FUAX_51300 [Fulvitalea axinellae]